MAQKKRAKKAKTIKNMSTAELQDRVVSGNAYDKTHSDSKKTDAYDQELKARRRIAKKKSRNQKIVNRRN